MGRTITVGGLLVVLAVAIFAMLVVAPAVQSVGDALTQSADTVERFGVTGEFPSPSPTSE